MILKPPDDNSSSMCLGNPPSYSAFVLGLAFTVIFQEVRHGLMSLGKGWLGYGQMEDKGICREV